MGTAAQPVVFTSARDDAFAGGTTGDTPPRPGDWTGIRIASDTGGAATGVFDHCIVRFGGAVSGLPGSSLTITNSTFAGSLNSAVECFGETARISNSTFQHNQNGVKVIHGTSTGNLSQRVVELRDTPSRRMPRIRSWSPTPSGSSSPPATPGPATGSTAS
jgi:hypothetical protein